MRRLRLGVLLAGAALACATAGRGPPSGLDDDTGREVLRRFARAVEAGRPAEALPLMSARWRAAYTPDRLAADLAGAGPSARDAAARVLAALDAGVALERDGAAGARLPVGTGRAAVLLPEGGAWRVDALE